MSQALFGHLQYTVCMVFFLYGMSKQWWIQDFRKEVSPLLATKREIHCGSTIISSHSVYVKLLVPGVTKHFVTATGCSPQPARQSGTTPLTEEKNCEDGNECVQDFD